VIVVFVLYGSKIVLSITEFISDNKQKYNQINYFLIKYLIIIGFLITIYSLILYNFSSQILHNNIIIYKSFILTQILLFGILYSSFTFYYYYVNITTNIEKNKVKKLFYNSQGKFFTIISWLIINILFTIYIILKPSKVNLNLVINSTALQNDFNIFYYLPIFLTILGITFFFYSNLNTYDIFYFRYLLLIFIFLHLSFLVIILFCLHYDLTKIINNVEYFNFIETLNEKQIISHNNKFSFYQKYQNLPESFNSHKNWFYNTKYNNIYKTNMYMWTKYNDIAIDYNSNHKNDIYFYKPVFYEYQINPIPTYKFVQLSKNPYINDPNWFINHLESNLTESPQINYNNTTNVVNNSNNNNTTITSSPTNSITSTNGSPQDSEMNTNWFSSDTNEFEPLPPSTSTDIK
jgi:hypothetical protein